MKVKILRDTVIRMDKGAIVEVSDAEAKRLAAFGNAEPAAEEKAAKPAAKKKAK